MFWSGNGALSDVWDWSEDHAGCPGVVARPPWKSESGREALSDVW